MITESEGSTQMEYAKRESVSVQMFQLWNRNCNEIKEQSDVKFTVPPALGGARSVIFEGGGERWSGRVGDKWNGEGGRSDRSKNKKYREMMRKEWNNNNDVEPKSHRD